MTTTLTASTTAQLNQDIATADAAASGGFIIDLQGNITATGQLNAIDLQPGVSLTIDGSNGSGGVHTLNGAGSHGFLVNAGSVTIENLGLSNAVLAGGSSSATVTLANDIFSRNVTIAHGLTVDEIAPVTFDSSTVTNQAGSTYDVGVIGSAFVAGPVGVSRFINKGTLAQTSLADAGSLGVSNIYVNVTDTGTLSVDGGSNLRFFGAHNSFSGTYVGAGMIDYWTGSINALGTINMTNGACTTVDGAIVNQNGVVTLSVNSTITNYGTWNFTSNNGLALADPSQPSSSGAAFTLYDALAKTGGTGTTVIGCDFNPNGGAGTIKVATGTLAFNGLVSNFYGAISGAGTLSNRRRWRRLDQRRHHHHYEGLDHCPVRHRRDLERGAELFGLFQRTAGHHPDADALERSDAEQFGELCRGDRQRLGRPDARRRPQGDNERRYGRRGRHH
jgi:hypothetical protein